MCLICPSAGPHQFELRTAIELGKRIILVHETEGVHGKFDFAKEKAAAAEDLRAVLDGQLIQQSTLLQSAERPLSLLR